MKNNKIFILNRQNGTITPSSIEDTEMQEELYFKAFSEILMDISLKINDKNHSIVLNQILPPLAEIYSTKNKKPMDQNEQELKIIIQKFRSSLKQNNLIYALEEHNKEYSLINSFFLELPISYIFRLIDTYGSFK